VLRLKGLLDAQLRSHIPNRGAHTYAHGQACTRACRRRHGHNHRRGHTYTARPHAALAPTAAQACTRTGKHDAHHERTMPQAHGQPPTRPTRAPGTCSQAPHRPRRQTRTSAHKHRHGHNPRRNPHAHPPPTTHTRRQSPQLKSGPCPWTPPLPPAPHPPPPGETLRGWCLAPASWRPGRRCRCRAGGPATPWAQSTR
jgi:hypothetical protein